MVYVWGKDFFLAGGMVGCDLINRWGNSIVRECVCMWMCVNVNVLGTSEEGVYQEGVTTSCGRTGRGISFMEAVIIRGCPCPPWPWSYIIWTCM